MALPSELEFFSFLAWTPRAQTREQRQLANWVKFDLKQDRRHESRGLASEYIARRLVEVVDRRRLDEEIGARALLVPIPRSSLLKPGDLWPAQRIASALVGRGLGRRVVRALRRHQALRPSSGRRASSERNRFEDQLRTLIVDAVIDASDRIVLVDDVITSGATMLGAAMALRARARDLDIRGFAAFRTISNLEEFEAPVAPFHGRIFATSDGATRARARA